ncbi:uncharacterized protein SOCE26_091170 [Sorangium cellulosum]|uniref:Uncharacterized protein n=1 Tax=Sorangium cellulosum TaxID=56 RepID=A0A2L0F7N4_SORCE|nr:uncharacterized protein SOCE26_091170 [Sorangium cellulosum]
MRGLGRGSWARIRGSRRPRSLGRCRRRPACRPRRTEPGSFPTRRRSYPSWKRSSPPASRPPTSASAACLWTRRPAAGSSRPCGLRGAVSRGFRGGPSSVGSTTPPTPTPTPNPGNYGRRGRGDVADVGARTGATGATAREAPSAPPARASGASARPAGKWTGPAAAVGHPGPGRRRRRPQGRARRVRRGVQGGRLGRLGRGRRLRWPRRQGGRERLPERRHRRAARQGDPARQRDRDVRRRPGRRRRRAPARRTRRNRPAKGIVTVRAAPVT